MARRSKELRKALVFKCYRYKTRGLSDADISQAERIPKSTVTWLLKEGDRITQGELGRLTLRDIQHELYLQLKERRRAAWQLYTTTRQDVVKASCLEKMDAMDERLVALGRLLKVVPDKGEETKPDARDLHITNIIRNIVQLPTEQLQALFEREARTLLGHGRGAEAAEGR